MRARELRFRRMHAALQAQLADDLRHHRLVAVGADAHLDLVGEVDALDVFEKAVHEMLARLLAVGDDVDAGVLLLLQREQRRVGLGGGKLVAREPPLRPELVRLGEPGGLRQAAGDGGLEHVSSRSVCWLIETYSLFEPRTSILGCAARRLPISGSTELQARDKF